VFFAVRLEGRRESFSWTYKGTGFQLLGWRLVQLYEAYKQQNSPELLIEGAVTYDNAELRYTLQPKEINLKFISACPDERSSHT
jgi:hypothetical protein